uniref:Uncharacterized protein n=1 Tax=Oryza meridionalis TaxID=40149 RepID=A0A0E0DSJ1_9ORYZ
MAAAAGVAARTGGGGGEGEGEELLLCAVEGVGGGGGGCTCAGDRPWRLNFDGLRRPEAHQEKPPRRFHDCLGVLVQSPGDDVAEYY